MVDKYPAANTISKLCPGYLYLALTAIEETVRWRFNARHLCCLNSSGQRIPPQAPGVPACVISFPCPVSSGFVPSFSLLVQMPATSPGTPLRPGWPPASISISAGSGRLQDLPGPLVQVWIAATQRIIPIGQRMAAKSISCHQIGWLAFSSQHGSAPFSSETMFHKRSSCLRQNIPASS